MTAPAFLSLLFPGGKPLYYETFFNGKQLTKHWMILEKASAEGYFFQLFLELDPTVAGKGGSLVKQRCRLQLDGELQPVRYMTEAQGARAILDFGADTIRATLPDGSRPDIPRNGAEFVVEANMTGLDAVLYANAHEKGRLVSGKEASFTLFLLNQLLSIPQNLTPAGDNRFTSSYGEELQFDEQGVLQSISIPNQGARSERREAPPLPYWHAQAGGTVPKEILRYRPAADATFRLEDVTLSSPRGPLGASVTVPRGEGPFPAVLFIAGTGSHDRHGIAGELDVGSHEIVNYLSEHGMLGLRYDSRGTGSTKSDGSFASGLRPLIDDARACLTYLRGRREVNAGRVFLLGHSQGGLIALVLATEAGEPPIRGIGLLASLGRHMTESSRSRSPARRSSWA